MSAIPKYISLKAEAVYDALGRGSLADTSAIARAILAERERCETIVGAFRIVKGEPGSQTVREATLSEIQTAIRGQQ